MVAELLDAGAKPDSVTVARALDRGRPPILELLLEEDVEPQVFADLRLPDGEKGDYEGYEETFGRVVKKLLERGAEPDARDYADETLLLRAVAAHGTVVNHDAILEGRDTRVILDGRVLVEVDGRMRNLDEVLPDLEAEAGDLLDRWDLMPVIHALLDAGADPNTTGGSGRTPLMHAGDADLVAALLEKGGNLEARDASGMGALTHAVDRNLQAVAGVLVAAGADAQARDGMGRPTVVAAGDGTLMSLVGAVAAGSDAEFGHLLEQGADPNAADASGVPVIVLAALRGNARIVEHLLQADVDLDAPGRNRGETALIVACREGYVEIVRLLVEAGADVQAIDHYKQSSLVEAAAKGHEEVISLLLKNGAGDSPSDESSARSLISAAAFGHTGIVGMLLAHGVDVVCRDSGGSTPLHYAVLGAHVETVRYLLDFGADPNAESENGYPPLGLSLDPDFFDLALHADVITMLLGAGAKLTGKANRVVFEAIEFGSQEILQLLLEGAPDQELMNRALVYAASLRNADMVEALIGAGGDPAAVDESGRTPLMNAAAEGDRLLVRLLLGAGADPKTIDRDGQTARDLARAGGRWWAAWLLKRAQG